MKKLSLVLTLVLFGVATMFAQRTVTGTVTDEGGEALIGASVLVKGTTSGTVTDIDGSYRVSVPEGADVLVFSYTGFSTLEVTLGASNVLDVTMAEGLTLETAVVTALGVTKEEKTLGYAVQTVESAELLRANETNLVQSLAGKVAGLQVTGSAGTAGASSFFVLRGPATINGSNQPLMVVDGVPLDNSQFRSGTGGAVASVAFSNRGIDLNQSEIESVTVLKGAAATALYGSLAGNGAIIITTKKGRAGAQKISVDFSQNLTISEVNKLPELQSSYGQGLFGAYQGPESRSAYSWGPLLDTMRYANDQLPLTEAMDIDGDGVYDWDRNGALVGQGSPFATDQRANAYDQYDFFQRGMLSNTNLAISASNETSSLRFSVGYSTEEGVIPKNTFNRLNLGLNANTKLGNKVDLGLGIQYINSGGVRIEQGSNISGVMLGLVRTTPSFDNSNGYDDPANEPLAYSFANGTPRAYRGLGGPTFRTTSVYDNPYWTVNQNPLRDNVNRVIANLSLNYRPTNWLTLTWRPGMDYYSDFRKQHFAILSGTLPAGQVFEDQYFVQRFNSDLLATINTDLSDDLNLNVTLGHNIRQFTTDRLYSQGDGLVIPNFYDLSNASNRFTFAENQISRNQGIFAMVDLGFRDYLYVSGTIRSESDLSLPEASNPYLYYSASGSFVFTEALGVSNNSALSFGKLRGSYGLVGLGTFPYSTDTYFTSGGYADGWTNGVLFPFRGQAGFGLQNTLGNPGLLPEIQKTLEFGVDLRFFRNRLGLDVTYYSALSEDIILAAPSTGSSGFTSSIQNAASISNKGWEAVLTARPVQTRDFTWDLLLNFTRNVNNVEALAEGVDQVFLGGFIGASTRAVVDNPYASIFGFGFYQDADGNRVIGADGFPIIDPNEKSFNSAQPDYMIGFRNTFSYKGFTLSALLDIKQGGYMWNGTRGALYFFGTHQETADLRNTTTVFDGNVGMFDSEGELMFDADGNPLTSGANTQEVLLDEDWLAFGNGNAFFGDNTEDFVEETSWIRLRDISLGYTFPSSMLKSARISYLTLSVSARNLWLSTPYSGIDPETNLYGASNAQGLDYFNMPGTKSYTIGVQVGF